MFYERKIKYLDYLVNRERCGNAGFIKLEARDTICNITINVTGLKTTDSLFAKVVLVGRGGEQELGSLELVNGRGRKEYLQMNAKDIGQTGIPYDALEAVRIPISAEREIYCEVWKRDDAELPQNRSGQTEMTVRQDVSEPVGQVEEPMTVPQEAEGSGESEKTEEPNPISDLIDTGDSDTGNEIRQSEEQLNKELITEDKTHIDVDNGMCKESICEEKKTSEQKMPLCDNKWEQLWAIYPHIAPFKDEREFLSIGPNDFVILPGRYFRMVNNSFLLHGYYNYKHLVLKKMECYGGIRYYIGVPGNFYDREKQVAIMFGFESFESQKEPAETGDYGYYLMRIEL